METDEALRELQAAVDARAVRGSLIFHLDLATELARAALVAQVVAVDALVTLVDEQGYRVLALDDWAAPNLVAIVRFAADGSAVTEPTSGAPPYLAAALARARRTIEQAFPGYVAIVIPPGPRVRAKTPLDAYAITRSPAPDCIAIGDHWQLLLSPDGTTIRDRAAFSDQPQSVAVQAEVSLQEAGAVPSEIITYLSLKHATTFDVLTDGSGLHWVVQGERSRVRHRKA